ncbi:polysaccharide deacetylase family protein [Patescibacteria group bacterium]|nr:polysaccharide deacetylase family protein [Patescibacteria group bacterium]
MSKGALIISLDFELYWGMRHKYQLNDCRNNLLAVRSIIPSLLKLFDEYKIHATWATVGLLFFENKNDLIRELPAVCPAYFNPKLSPYQSINNIGANEKEDPFHYADSLIKLIASYPNQEIATHTFSHYCCLEPGQNKEEFRYDLKSAVEVAKKYNINIESIIFPYNQINDQYLLICKEIGLKAYRGNESSWLYKTRSMGEESLIRRILRLVDVYFNISGHNAYSLNDVSRNPPINIPSSRFLRPYWPALKFLELLRLHRILSDLDYAAKNNLIYHLWWHPRNFGEGDEIEKNLSFLKKILDHFLDLQKKYGMKSLNMRELISN